MTEFDNAVEQAHGDVAEIFRTTVDDVAGACRQARDRLARLPGFDPAAPHTWPAAAVLATDLRVLLGFLSEAAIPCAEPAGFRALTLAVLDYLRLAEETELAMAIAAQTRRRWTAELDPDHPDRISAVGLYAGALRAGGHDSTALPLVQEAYEAWCRNYGQNDERVLTAAANLCGCLNALDDRQNALRLGQDIVLTSRRSLGDNSSVTLHATTQFATSLLGLGEHRTALGAYRDVHARYTRLYSADHLTTLAAAENVAIALDTVGDIEAARAMNEDVLRHYERLIGTKDPFTDKNRRIGRVRDRLSANLRALGRDEQARSL